MIRMRLRSSLLVTLTLAFTLLALPTYAGAAPEAQMAQVTREVTVLLDDLPVAFPVSPYLEVDTTMVPLRALSEALGFKVIWTGEGSPITCVKDGRRITLKLGDTAVTVQDKGVTRQATLIRAAHLQGDSTVVPLRFFSETLGYQVSWDDASSTANVKSPKSSMEVWGFYALGNQDYPSWEDLFGQKYPYPMLPGPATPASKMAGAFMGWFAVSPDGAISSSGHPSGFAKPEGWEAVLLKMRAAGAKPVAMFYADNKDGKLSAILADQGLRERLALNMAAAVTVDYDGAGVDFEGLGFDPATAQKDAANLNAFMESLRRYLQGRKVYAVVPPLNGAYKGYDHKKLGELSDFMVVMAYGYEDALTPSPTAPWARVDEAIRLELALVPKEKVILGIPAYGTVYSSSTDTVAIERPAARDVVWPEGTKAVFNPQSSSAEATWKENDRTFTSYTETNGSLQARISLAKRYGLRGVAIWRLGFLSPGWWDAVQSVVNPSR